MPSRMPEAAAVASSENRSEGHAREETARVEDSDDEPREIAESSIGVVKSERVTCSVPRTIDGMRVVSRPLRRSEEASGFVLPRLDCRPD